jgi:hypothetical protein
MPEFMVHHTHEPEDCQRLFEEWKAYDTPLKGKGDTFFCSCPSGEHGGFFHVEAASKEEVMTLMPEAHRATSTVYGGETMPLDV